MQRQERGTSSLIQYRPLTHKMLSFACNVAAGMTLADAYRASFNTVNMQAKTVRDEASRLAKNPGVTAAITQERERIRRQNRISALKQEDRIWTSLWLLAENEDIAPSVRVKALSLAAQLCGMFNAPAEKQPTSSAKIGAELERRIRTISG